MRVIFSVDKGLNKQDVESRLEAIDYMWERGITNRTGLGCYKGKQEICFEVDLPNTLTFNVIRSLARTYKQESVLLLDDNGLATLVYWNDKAEYIGKYIPVSEEEALQQDAWSKFNNQYYIVKG